MQINLKIIMLCKRPWTERVYTMQFHSYKILESCSESRPVVSWGGEMDLPGLKRLKNDECLYP